MHQFVLLSLTILGPVIAQQPKDSLTPPDGPSDDYVDRGQDGSYRFGYKNLDLGAHYHSAAASRDNTVSGRYGYRDPASRRITQTTYTAGNRGFRARGPDIARLMDLSQNKIPYQPPVPSDSPNYQPSYSGYHDPNEDPSYRYGQKTPTYSKSETADSKGTVNGAFSYIDDVGKRHDVNYEAGSNTGFVVKTPFPDSDPFGGLFYQGPNKPGTPPRGHSAIVQNNDGSYQFTVSGPDQKRVEVSDAVGHVRGSYTYVDDKGVQRTVHYVAGPNIGYKVIRKGTGPVFSSVYPYTSPEFQQPPFTDGPPVSLMPPSLSSSRVTPALVPGDLFEPTNVDSSKPSNSKIAFDFPLATNKPPPASTFTPDILPSTSLYEPPPKPTILDPNDFNSGSSIFGASNSGGKQQPQSFDDIFGSSKSEYDDAGANDYGGRGSFRRLGNRKPDGGLRKPSNSYLYPKPDRSFKEELPRDYLSAIDDNRYSETNKNFLGLPPGVLIRAHVQSLDIQPFGSKIPPPDETLQRHLLEERYHRDRCWWVRGKRYQRRKPYVIFKVYG